MEHSNGIQQHFVSISVFARIFYLLLSGSPEDEKFHPPLGEPDFLCLGRAGVHCADAVFHFVRLYSRHFDRQVQKQEGVSLSADFLHCDKSFDAGIF